MIFKLLIGILALIAIGISIYAYNNLNYDRDINKLIEKSKTIEKQVMLPDGAILNYGEGEVDKGIPLLLLHGQMVSWEDYAKVLPELSKKFHIYAFLTITFCHHFLLFLSYWCLLLIEPLMLQCCFL